MNTICRHVVYAVLLGKPATNNNKLVAVETICNNIYHQRTLLSVAVEFITAVMAVEMIAPCR